MSIPTRNSMSCNKISNIREDHNYITSVIRLETRAVRSKDAWSRTERSVVAGTNLIHFRKLARSILKNSSRIISQKKQKNLRATNNLGNNLFPKRIFSLLRSAEN